jgi:transcriptional regulator of acetoin/glycerol metabolism
VSGHLQFDITPGGALFDEDGHVRSLGDIQRRVLIVALERYEGDASAVSQALQMSRSTLYRRFVQYGLDPARFRR